MAIITYEIATDIEKDNIAIEKKFADGKHTSYRLTANEGYVLYDLTGDEEVVDPETNTMTIIKNYYNYVVIPVRYTPDTWQWEATPKSEVSEADKIN